MRIILFLASISISLSLPFVPDCSVRANLYHKICVRADTQCTLQLMTECANLELCSLKTSGAQVNMLESFVL
jgi:hypothetical protein